MKLANLVLTRDSQGSLQKEIDDVNKELTAIKGGKKSHQLDKAESAKDLDALKKPSYNDESLNNIALLGEMSERTIYRNIKNDIILEELQKVIREKMAGAELPDVESADELRGMKKSLKVLQFTLDRMFSTEEIQQLDFNAENKIELIQGATFQLKLPVLNLPSPIHVAVEYFNLFTNASMDKRELGSMFSIQTSKVPNAKTGQEYDTPRSFCLTGGKTDFQIPFMYITIKCAQDPRASDMYLTLRFLAGEIKEQVVARGSQMNYTRE